MPVPPAYKPLLKLILLSKDIDALNPNNHQLGATAEAACSLVEIFASPHGDDSISSDLPSDIVLLGNQGFVGAGICKGLLARGLSFVGIDAKNGGRGFEFRPPSGLQNSPLQICWNVDDAVRAARIIVSATDCCGSVTSSMLLGEINQTIVSKTPNFNSNLPQAKALVVDVGFSKDPLTGAFRGDVHQDVHLTPGTVTHLTPVSCGVGPLEMALLLLRFARSCAGQEYESKQQQREEEDSLKDRGANNG